MSISIVIPVYQAERFIEKAVQSACEQEETSEVILVEDGSTDNSLELCRSLVKKYQPRVKLFQHVDQQNHGAGASRNLGIKKAEGKFIAFLDADDYYLPDRFKRDFEILQSDALVDGVYNALGVYIYDEEERERINYNLTTVTYPIPPDKLFEEMSPIGASGYFHGDTLTVRREAFDSVGLFDETLELTQDAHMWIKMAAKVSLVAGIIDRPVAIRGVHSGNRIKNIAKFNYYFPLLFLSLLNWATKENISVYRKRLLWDCLYRRNYNLVHSQQSHKFIKKVKIFFFLILHGVNKPYLLMHKTYINSLFSQKRGLVIVK